MKVGHFIGGVWGAVYLVGDRDGLCFAKNVLRL